MTLPSLRQIAGALSASEVEIFAEGERELQIAERIRMHLMDSGVRVRLREGSAEVTFTATASRAAHPMAEPEELVARVRAAIGARAEARGYVEVGVIETEARDPMNPDRVLDVFHGVEYARRIADVAKLGDEVRWAVTLDKSLASS